MLDPAFYLKEIHYLAVVIATIAGVLLGVLWYLAPLFGNAWMKELGLKKEDIQSSVTPMIVTIILTLIIAFSLEVLIIGLDIKSVQGAALLGLLVGIFFLATNMLSDFLFNGWSKRLFLILAGYRVVMLIVMAAILNLWR